MSFSSFLASIYRYIYIIFVALITFACVRRYKTTAMRPSDNTRGELFLVLIMCLFIGFRPNSVWFVDMYAYNRFFQIMRGEFFEFNWDAENKIFDNLEMWWACKDVGARLFFLLMAVIYFLCTYIGIKRLFSNHALIAYIVFLGAFSTFSYGTNGIKAGAAASIFIMALGYWDKLYICIPLMLVSWGFHHSMVMPIAAFFVCLFFKNSKWYYYGWFVCFLMALFHISYFQSLFGGMTDDHGARYLLDIKDSADTRIGRFRPDFVLYSAIPVVIGYVMEIRRQMKLSKTYRTLIHFYTITNAIWMLCMYAQFSNRIAYLSWFVYPIVIIYPFLDVYNKDINKYRKLHKTVLYHLYFTLFMYFIYYGLFSLGT